MHNRMTRQMTQGAIAPLARFLSIALALMLASCATQSPSANDSSQPTEPEATSPSQAEDVSQPDESPQTEEIAQAEDMLATVTATEVTTGDPGAYTFSVTIQSQETGCDQYANWWEVVSEEGDLIYRRILAHSHVDEQPFSRTGGPVAIQPDQPVIVRAHMDPQGYGTQAMQGTVENGFEEVTLPEGFAAELAEAEPQPSGCTF